MNYINIIIVNNKIIPALKEQADCFVRLFP